jgi:hypothetical protein
LREEFSEENELRLYQCISDFEICFGVGKELCDEKNLILVVKKMRLIHLKKISEVEGKELIRRMNNELRYSVKRKDLIRNLIIQPDPYRRKRRRI